MLLWLHAAEFLAPLIFISVWLFPLLVSFFISQSDKGEHEGDTLPSRPLFNHLLCVISSISWFVLSYEVTNEKKKRWTQTWQKNNNTSFSLSSSKEIHKQKKMSSRSNDLFFSPPICVFFHFDLKTSVMLSALFLLTFHLKLQTIQAILNVIHLIYSVCIEREKVGRATMVKASENTH